MAHWIHWRETHRGGAAKPWAAVKISSERFSCPSLTLKQIWVSCRELSKRIHQTRTSQTIGSITWGIYIGFCFRFEIYISLTGNSSCTSYSLFWTPRSKGRSNFCLYSQPGAWTLGPFGIPRTRPQPPFSHLASHSTLQIYPGKSCNVLRNFGPVGLFKWLGHHCFNAWTWHNTEISS